MNYFQNGRIVIDLEEEQGQKVWMITKLRTPDGQVWIAMARDIFGDMTLDDDEELLEPEKYSEEEAERMCIEWSARTGLEFLNK
ncbi:MAG: hypothetical protein ACRKFN_04580 [Desulfitobacterium sp.]